MQAAQCRGVMAVMVPAGYALSPVCGLLALSAPSFASNAFSINMSDHLHGLCRELFHAPGDGAALRPTTSRSRAAAHLSPQLLGHVVGLAVTGAREGYVKECLAENGVRTNKVHGEWTGVSLARFQRLVQLVGGVWREDTHVRGGTALLMRFLWEKALSKDDLLAYLMALHSHFPVLQSSFAHDTARHAEWLTSCFAPDELECEASLLASANALLDRSLPDDCFAGHVERVAASLSSVHTWRSPIRLQRHAYKGGREVPDCVEVVVREIIELLLYDPDARGYDLARLPPDASPALQDFFSRPFSSAREASESWFALCQELPGPEYLSVAPGGEAYELKPLMSTVARALQALLARAGSSRVGAWQSIEEFAAHWGRGVRVHVERRVKRGLVNEEGRLEERAQIVVEGSPFSIEITLEAAVNLATVRHRRLRGAWAARGSPALERHLDVWTSTGGEGAGKRVCVLNALRPALLGSSMIDRLAQASDAGGTHARLEHRLVTEAVMSAPIRREDRLRWDASHVSEHEANASVAARRAREELAWTRCEFALAAAARFVRGNDCETKAAGYALAAGVLGTVPASTPAPQVARALAAFPAALLRNEKGPLVDGLKKLEEAGGEGAKTRRLVSAVVAREGCGLQEAVEGLAFLDALIVLWHVGALRWRRWRERVVYSMHAQ